MAYAVALGEAQYLLGELADIAERPSDVGTAGAAGEDTRRLGEIRDVLAAFDWEHDDHQYALEKIGRLADGGQP